MAEQTSGDPTQAAASARPHSGVRNWPARCFGVFVVWIGANIALDALAHRLPGGAWPDTSSAWSDAVLAALGQIEAIARWTLIRVSLIVIVRWVFGVSFDRIARL